ncbi:MAG: porin [Bacillota bacterium]
MKKSLLALAVLGAFAGAAQAQSAVTIYGSFDGGVRHQNRTVADTPGTNGGVWTMGSNGQYNSNRIGFKGVEDLGGGLNAHFNLETGFNTGTGVQDGALFNRSAFVGLGGSWGSLDFGHQYSTNFKVVGTYDPFSYKYVAIIPLAGLGSIGGGTSGVGGRVGALTRLDNDVQYSGKFGPVTAYAEHAFGEQAGSFGNASTNAVGAVYAEGPISVGGAYTVRKIDTSALGGAGFQSNTSWTVGGAYATGPVRVAAGYSDTKQDLGSVAGLTQPRAKNWWVGGSYNLNAETALSAGYYETKTTDLTSVETKRKLFIVGGTYALSKRTNFYADIDNGRYSVSTGTAPTTLTGVSVGINHLF